MCPSCVSICTVYYFDFLNFCVVQGWANRHEEGVTFDFPLCMETQKPVNWGYFLTFHFDKNGLGLKTWPLLTFTLTIWGVSTTFDFPLYSSNMTGKKGTTFYFPLFTSRAQSESESDDFSVIEARPPTEAIQDPRKIKFIPFSETLYRILSHLSSFGHSCLIYIPKLIFSTMSCRKDDKSHPIS
jgi:hypothetical protein